MGKASQRKRERSARAAHPEDIQGSVRRAMDDTSRRPRVDFTITFVTGALSMLLGGLFPPATALRAVAWTCVLVAGAIYPFWHLSEFVAQSLRQDNENAWRRLPSVMVTLLSLLFAALLGLQFWMELRPIARFNASITPGYQNEYQIGKLTWKAEYYAIGLQIDNSSEFPIRDFELTVSALDVGTQFAGMEQRSHIPGVETYSPDLTEDRHIQLLGKDGKDYDVSVRDMFHQAFQNGLPYNRAWVLSCPRLSASNPLSLVIAGLGTTQATRLRIKGEYQATSTFGSRTITFDRVLDVSR